MSGIYGIINLKGSAVEKSQMDKMEELLSHRGRDGKGQWIDDSVGLGHLKLEITPESEYEKMPLEYKQWVITADARIDNRDELHIPLSIPDEEQPLTPDTTYIVKAYEKWGKDCVKHLIGDFAFVILDKVEKTLFCARDHIGVKPFFYLKTDDKFIFASELKPIVELKEIIIELNEHKLGDFMLVMQDIYSPEETLFIGIKRLLPSTFGILNKGSLNLNCYWQLNHSKEIKFKNAEDYLIKYQDLVKNAVECRMRTKFPIGVTLSGGLDSSSIACIAARKLAIKQKKLYSVSSVLPENWTGIEEDEREYINEVLKQEENITPYFITKEDAHFFSNLDEVLKNTYIPVNAFYTMDIALSEKLKKERNVRLILSGFTGDMAASQKANQVVYFLIEKGRILIALKLIKAQCVLINKKNYLKPFFKTIIKVLIPNILKKAYAHFYLKSESFKFVLNPSFDNKYKVFHKYKLVNNKNFIENNIYIHIKDAFDGTVKNIEEFNIQRSFSNMEECYPLADIRILEYLINIPPEHFQFNGWQRGLLRFAMNNILPQKIQFRKDKCAYMPNYNRNVLLNSTYLLNEIENNTYSQKYLSNNYLKKILGGGIIFKNWNESKSNVNLILVVHELIILRFVKIIFGK